MKKTFTAVIALITVVLLIGGVYVRVPKSTKNIIPTPEESDITISTSSNEYENLTYGFSFKYNPIEYTITESKTRGGANGEESDLIRITKIDETCPTADIFISTATLDEELNDLEFKLNGETTETTVDGIPATMKTGEITENIPPCGSEMTEVVFEHEGNVFLISAFKNSENTLNELLESIKF